MSDELILIEKDVQQIRVHPGTLENHKQLGWKVVEPTDEVAAEKSAPEAVVEDVPVHPEKPAKKGKS